MAELKDLAGTPCPHGLPIIVVGEVATCQAGCLTTTLRAWAEKGGDANEAIIDSDDNRTNRAAKRRLDNATPVVEGRVNGGRAVNGNAPPEVTADGAPEDRTALAMAAAENNGHVPARQVPTLIEYRVEILRLAEILLRHPDGVYQQKAVPAGVMLEPLIKDVKDSLVVEKGGHWQPSGFSKTDLDEEVEGISRRALEEWAGGIDLLVPAVPTVPAIHPDDILRPLNLGELFDLCDQWDRQPWVWEGILPHSSLSLIVGKSETGKSTLIYALIYSIIRGLSFLGRQCEPGRVLYLAGDPMSEVVAGKTFRALDMGRDDGVMVLPGALVNNPSAMGQLKNIVADFKPALIVGDTLAATVALDTDKYGQSYSSQQPLSRLARESGANFLMAHHSQKAAVDSYNVVDAALGSVGVAAVASTRMVTRLYRRGKDKFHTFEMSNLRIGQPIEGEWIVRKLENGLVDLGGLWGARAVELDREAIMVALEAQKKDQWVSGRTLFQEVTPKPKYGAFMKALREMVKAGLVEDDKKSGKGGGWVYRKSTGGIPNQVPLYEQN